MVLLMVGACGPLPMPFTKDAQTTRSDLIYKNLPPVVAVNAVNGTSIPMAKLLAESVAEELSSKEVIAYSGDKGASTHILDGWVENINDTDNAIRNPVPRHILWALTKRNGELVHSFKQTFQASSLDWDYGSPRVIREIGEGTALQVGEILVGDIVPAEQSVASNGGVWMTPVIDAPGDGNYSLTRAMGYALSDVGVEVVRKPEEATFNLRAQVRVDSPVSDEQQVQIDWIVSDRDGEEIGRASQSNSVPAGTFNGRWGQMAAMISVAAAGSVRDIIAQEQNRRLTPESRGLSNPFSTPEIKEAPRLPPPSLSPDPGPNNPS